MAVRQEAFRVAESATEKRQGYLHYLCTQRNCKFFLKREVRSRPNHICIKAKTANHTVDVGVVPESVAGKIAGVMDRGQFVYINKAVISKDSSEQMVLDMKVGWYA